MKKELEKNDELYKDYLKDLVNLLKDYSMKIEKHDDFNNGYRFAFFKIISLMKQQADVFGIPYNELGIEEIDEYRDLL